MKAICVLFLVLCIPTVSQASVFGFLFGTDDPNVEMHRTQVRHDREMAKRQMSHNQKMAKMDAKHQKDMAKRGVSVSRSVSRPVQVKTYAYHQQGSVRFYYAK